LSQKLGDVKAEPCQNQMGPGNVPDSSVIVISDDDDQDMENVSNNPPKIVSTSNYNTMIFPHAPHFCRSGSEQHENLSIQTSPEPLHIAPYVK